MTKSMRIYVFAVVIGALTGCATLRDGGAPQPAFDIDADLADISKSFPDAATIATYNKAPSKEARNSFITARLVQYNLRYLQYIRALGADKQNLDAASDLLVLGLALGGTLTGGERAKTVLAAVAASIVGGKTIIDKDFFYDKTVSALIAAMNAKRKEVLLRIVTGTKVELEEYSFDQAYADTLDYYQAGTLQGAIDAITVDSGNKANQADMEIRRLSRVTTTDLANRDRVHRTIVKLVADRDEVKITALLGALNLDTSGDLDAKIARLESAHRSANTSEAVNGIKAALAKTSITLLD
jgi:hypothetical protein